MNVERARALDRRLGIPLCYIGTIARRLFRVFRAGPKERKPRRILLIELSEMGSAVLAEPAMRKLRHSLDAELYFAIFQRNRAVLDLLGSVPAERTIALREAGLWALAADTVRFFIWARRKRIDTVIDLELFARFTALLAGLSGASRTVGFHRFTSEGLYRGDFYTHKVAFNPHLHVAKNYIALVNALLSEREEVPYSKTVIADDELELPRIAASEEAKVEMLGTIATACPAFDRQRSHVVLLNTDSSDLVPLRRWPQQHFVRLARILLERYPTVVILLTGSSAERSGKQALIEAVHSDRCVNFSGRTTIQNLPTLYSLSLAMITNDSGPAHVASLSGMPTIVLFGPETPGLYRPLGEATVLHSSLACSPCISFANYRKSACNDNVCLQAIAPEQVLDALAHVLEGLPRAVNDE